MTDLPFEKNALPPIAVQSVVPIGPFRVAAFAMLVALCAIAAVNVPGCKATADEPVYPGPAITTAIDGASTATAKADAQLTTIGTTATAVEPHVQPIGKPLVAVITTAAAEGRKNVAEAAVELGNAKAAARDDAEAHRKQIEAERDRTAAEAWRAEKAESQFGYVAWTWITWAWWWLVAFFAVSFALRIAAMFVGGWAGKTMAVIGSFGFNLLTGGVGFFNSFFDNAYFRDRAGKLNPGVA
jgi:hypothetical protein